MPNLNVADVLHTLTDLYMQNLRLKDVHARQIEILQQKIKELEDKTSQLEPVPSPAGPRPIPKT